MKKDILVNEEKTEVTLMLSLTHRVMARDPVMTITTRMAHQMLENEDFKLDKCLISDIIDNHNDNSKHDGTWKFSLVRELPATKKNETVSVNVKVNKSNSKKSKKQYKERENNLPHVSFSAIKDWKFCAYYHKLTRIDKIRVFEGNVFTAFGKAIHDTCESMLLSRELEKEFDAKSFFNKCLDNEAKQLKEDVRPSDEDLEQFRTQGHEIIPHIIPAMDEYFGDFKLVSSEEEIHEKLFYKTDDNFTFKGYVDCLVKTSDGKYHVIDWKSCSWGWDMKKRTDPMVTYQLTYYKHFLSEKRNIPKEDIETHFALLKRVGKKNRVEIFRVTSGEKKTNNALKLLEQSVYNIDRQNYVKNRLSCSRCDFKGTVHCPQVNI